MVPFPLGQVSGVFVPFLHLELYVAVDDFVAHCGPQNLALVGEAEGIQQVQRQFLCAFGFMTLGLHIDIQSVSWIALVGDAVETRGEHPGGAQIRIHGAIH